MARKLQLSDTVSGSNIYATIRSRTNGYIWDGADLVVFVGANMANYDVACTEQGSTGYYDVDVPEALPAGQYMVVFYTRAGGTPAQTDNAVDDGDYFFDWDGTDIVEELETGSVSVTDICNLAISHLGVGKEVGNVETDDDEEASAFNRFYETTRDEVLREFPWPFAVKTVDLGLVEEDPTVEWAYSYRYPSNAIQLKRILSGIRNDNQDSRIPYRITRDDGGLLIYTDLEDATLEYIFRETDPGRFPSDFVTALSYLLAFKMAPRLTKGDPFKLGNRAYEAYMMAIGKAKADAANEEVSEREPESEFIRSRD